MTIKYVRCQAYCETCKKVTVFKKPAPTAIWKAGLPPIYMEVEPWICVLKMINKKKVKGLPAVALTVQGCGEAMMK